MKNRSTWLTWAVVAALVIFAGFASAIVPFVIDGLQADDEAEIAQETQPNEAAVDVGQLPFIGEVLVDIPFIQEYIQGRIISLFQAFALMTGVILIAVGGLGLVIAGAMLLIGRMVTKVESAESYQEAVTGLDRRQQELLKERRSKQPTAPPTDPERSARGFAYVFSFLILVMVWISVLGFSYSLFKDVVWDIFGLEISASVGLAILAGLVTIIVLALTWGRRDPLEVAEPKSDYNPVNWGMVWVLITGLLIVGLGTGVAIALTSS